MKKFDTKKIKIKSKKEPSIEEKLTGSVISELKTDKVEPNAELEGDEIVEFPDGLIQTVKGEPHSKGGVKMNIPDGTRILSNKLTLAKKDVARLKDKYDLNASTNDTYAKAFDKFLKKSGITRLNDEQKGYFETLKKQLESGSIPDATFRLNQEHLSKKISEIEMQKQTKEKVKGDVFDDIFKMQEASKSDDKKKKSEGGEYKYGGVYRKYGLGGGVLPMNNQPLGRLPYENMFVDPYANMSGPMDTMAYPPVDSQYMNKPPVNLDIIEMMDQKYRRDYEDYIRNLNDPTNIQRATPRMQQEFKMKQGLTRAEKGGEFNLSQIKILPKAKTSFEKGGKSGYGNLTQSQFEALCKKYGMTEEQGRVLLLSKTKKYARGGVANTGEPYVVVNPDGSYVLRGGEEDIPLNKGEYKINSDGTMDVFKQVGAARMITAPYYYQNPQSQQEELLTPDEYTQGDYVSMAALDKVAPADVKVVQNTDGNFEVVKNTGTETPVVTTKKSEEVKVNEDGTVTLKEEDKEVTVPYTIVNKETGEEVPAVTKVAESVDKAPKGMTKQEYLALKKQLDSPIKIAKAYSEGKIDAETANKLQFILDNKSQGLFRTSTASKSVYSRAELYPREQQKASDAAHGNITKEDLPQVLKYLYINFPDIVASEDVFGVKFDEAGNLIYDENVDFTQASKQVENFQKRAQERMKATARVVLDNWQAFDAKDVEEARRFLNEETFGEGDGPEYTARHFDARLGNFTSGRYNLGVDVVSDEELKSLNALNIYTVKDLNKALEENPDLISDASRARLYEISDIMSDDSDFLLNPTVPPPPAEEPQPEAEKLKDDIVAGPPKIPRRYFTPDVAPLPPTAMQPHLMAQSQFGLAEPVRIGIEQQIQTSNDIMRDVSRQLEGLPPQQRALVAAQMQAERGKQLNEAAYQANITNAQNLANTELFNIGQRDRQSEADIRNKLSFEQRQYTALANTQEEFKRYFDRLNDIRLNEYSINQNLNMINEMFPDYSLGASGMGVDYTPEGNFQVQKPNQYSMLWGNPFIVS
jgi:hypothetical protein